MHRAAAPALIFFLALTVYAVSPVKVQSDTIYTIPPVVSLLDEGNADLDEFRPTTEVSPHGIVESHGHLYSGFPLGPSLAALPLLAAFDGFVRWTVPIAERVPTLRVASERWRTRFHAVGQVDLVFYDTIELLVASLFVSGAAVFVFLTGRQVASPASALIVTLLFMFGTSAYSTASRVLWQHSPSILTLAAVLFLLTRPAQTWRAALGVGVLSALAFTFRPTNAITIFGCAAYFLATRPRWLVPFALGGLVGPGLSAGARPPGVDGTAVGAVGPGRQRVHVPQQVQTGQPHLDPGGRPQGLVPGDDVARGGLQGEREAAGPGKSARRE